MASASTRFAAPQQFQGFPPGGFDFFFELQARQSREWFKANKERYQQLWVRPMEALLADLAVRLSDVFPEMPSSPTHVFRIQRDTRFSLDKSPYKTHVAAHVHVRPFAEGESWVVPSVYVHFGLDEDVIGVGKWDMDKDVVSRLRAAVADERRGTDLRRLVDQLRPRGFHLASHEALKRVPAPYPQDHPRAELLKLKGLSISREDIPEELMPKPEFLDWMAEQLHQAAPIAIWLENTLAPGTSEPVARSLT